MDRDLPVAWLEVERLAPRRREREDELAAPEEAFGFRQRLT